MLVPVGGVIRAGDQDSANALFQRQLVDALRHVDVATLVLIIAGAPASHPLAWRAEVAQVDDHIATGKQGPQAIDAVVDEVGHLNAGDRLAVAVHGPDVG